MMATLGTTFPAITAITILVFEVKAVIRSVLQLTLNDLLVGILTSKFYARNVTKTTKKPSNVSAH